MQQGQVARSPQPPPPACQSSLGVVGPCLHQRNTNVCQEKRRGGELGESPVFYFLILVTDKTRVIKCLSVNDQSVVEENTKPTSRQMVEKWQLSCKRLFLCGLFMYGHAGSALTMSLGASRDFSNWVTPSLLSDPASIDCGRLTAGLCLDHSTEELTESQRQRQR